MPSPARRIEGQKLGLPRGHRSPGDSLRSRTHRAGVTSPLRALGWMSSNHSEGTETYIIPLDFALNCKHQNGTFY